MRLARREAALPLLFGVLLMVWFSGAAAGQGTASLEGHIFDAQTGKALDGVRVSVIGQSTHAITADSGFYRLASLPIGILNLRIEQKGYATAVEQVDVVDRSEADFSLLPAATVLKAIVVRGHAPDHLPSEGSAKSVTTPGRSSEVTTPSELVARVPGARVIPGGQVGSGSSVQLRGLKSLISASDPVIYLDGVRVSGGAPSRPFRRYTEPSMLDLLPPSSIDRIEVLPGPAAAMLYGEGAANGVILIYTKRGGT